MESLPHTATEVWIFATIQQDYLVFHWIFAFVLFCFALGQLTENEKFVDNAQQCFAFTLQAKIKQKIYSHLLYGEVDFLKPN